MHYPPTARLLLVRHAIAQERDDFARTGRNDGDRPLTEKGRRRMQLAAKGLRSLIDEIDLLTTSPLIRAAETADIISEEFGGTSVEEVEMLAMGPADAFLSWYRIASDSGLVVVVGHEPYLGEWASWLLAGPSADFMVFKKGRAILHWHLAPSHLRTLGGRA